MNLEEDREKKKFLGAVKRLRERAPPRAPDRRSPSPPPPIDPPDDDWEEVPVNFVPRRDEVPPPVLSDMDLALIALELREDSTCEISLSLFL